MPGSLIQVDLFLAGADIKEMQNNTLSKVVGSGFLDEWSAIAKVKKPIIAAVNGFAVGVTIPTLPRSAIKYLF